MLRETSKLIEGKRNLFVTSAYTSTNCSANTQKNELYGKLTTLVHSSKSPGIVLVAGYFGTRWEACLGGRRALSAQLTDNENKQLRLHAGNRLFLSTSVSDTVRFAQQYDVLPR